MSGPVWHDIRLGENASRNHAQRFEDSIAQELAVKVVRHLANQNAECHVTDIAIAPLIAQGNASGVFIKRVNSSPSE
jgi:hypothetical protein